MVDHRCAFLICEATTEAVKPRIKEVIKNEKMRSVIIDSKLQDADVFNRNKRLYEYGGLDHGLRQPHIVELQRMKQWVGEAGHPSNPTMERQMSIDNNNVSHRINKWWWDNKTVVGEVQTLDYGDNSPGRKMYDNIVLYDMKVAFSLRAVGPVQVTPKGKIVKKPIHIVGYDWVYLPSHKVAYQIQIKEVINSIKGDTKLIAESFCTPVSEESAIDFIKTESKNLKIISETLDFCYDNIQLTENGRGIILMEGNSKLVMPVENYITREIYGDYMSKFI